MGAKQSKVGLLEVERDSPLEDILRKTLGEKVTVVKNRHIYFIGNVKFHVDSKISRKSGR